MLRDASRRPSTVLLPVLLLFFKNEIRNLPLALALDHSSLAELIQPSPKDVGCLRTRRSKDPSLVLDAATPQDDEEPRPRKEQLVGVMVRIL
jgi:hypothetical protein